MSFFKNIKGLSNEKDNEKCCGEWEITSELRLNEDFGYELPDNEIRCICSKNLKYYYVGENVITGLGVKLGTSCCKRIDGGMGSNKDEAIDVNIDDKIAKETDKNLKKKLITKKTKIDDKIVENLESGVFRKITDLLDYTRNVLVEHLGHKSLEHIEKLIQIYNENHPIKKEIVKVRDSLLRKRNMKNHNKYLTDLRRNPYRFEPYMWEEDYEEERDYSGEAEQNPIPVGQRPPSRYNSFMWEDDYELERDCGDLWLLKKGVWIRNPNTFMGVQKKYIPAYPINYPPSSSDDNGAWALM